MTQHFLTLRMTRFITRRLLVIIASLLPAAVLACPLAPYELQYSTRIAGFSVTLVRSLEAVDNACVLQQKASALIGSLTETSRFSVGDQWIQPLRYEYRNPFRKSRSQDLRFDWESAQAWQHGESSRIAITHGTMDRLSVQEQIRLDLQSNGPEALPKDYPVLDDDKLKTYRITYEAQETLETPLGKRPSHRIRQQRPGKDKYTLLWLSADAHWLPLKIQQIEDGKLDGELLIESVQISAAPEDRQGIAHHEK